MIEYKIGIFDTKGKYNNPLNNLPYSDEYKLLTNMWKNLPAYKKGKEIVNSIIDNDVILIKSETGSGKSVLVPKFALHSLNYNGSIIMTLPKKIITQTTAEFAAKTLDTEIGEYIGYQYRGKQVKSNKTILLFSTDGSIISMIKSDPLLLNIDLLIIDEAHERKIQIDLLLYLIKSAIQSRKEQKLKPLKLIIMSATIDEKLFEEYYKEFKFKYLFLSGETNYEIKTQFLEKSILNIQNEYVNSGIDRIEKIITSINNKKLEEGDILFFVTSVSECITISEKLESKFKDSFVMALYSNYPQELKPYITNPLEYKHLNPSFKRRIFISTNVAESSLTIDGITFVIDSGLEINVFYNAKRKVNVMNKQFITQAQMRQRKGRAGRLKSGYCYHLYTKEEMENAQAYPEPEIKKIDLKNISLSFMKISNNIKKSETTFDDVREIYKKLIQPPFGIYIDDSYEFLKKHKLIENNIITEMGSLVMEIKMDIFQSLTLLYAYQYGKSIFKKVFLILTILEKMKNGINDFFFDDTEKSEIKKIIKKINYDHSEFILIYELFKLIVSDDSDDIKLYNKNFCKNIKQLYNKKFRQIHTIFRNYNYKLNLTENNDKITDDKINEKIIECFNYGFSENKAFKKNDKFYFNGIECKEDTFINIKNIDSIIFYSNVLMRNKLKINIISK
jgi:HrpA-like RNA helicase